MLTLRRGPVISLPLFIPVYQPDSNLIPIEALKQDYGIRGMIVNGFFLYKQAAVRQELEAGRNLHDYIGFDGMIMTDSGAFQGLKRPLYLSNKKIVRFQDQIGADIVSPLDLITPPGDKRTVAEKKMHATHKRIREAHQIVERGILAGVQQGGKFLDLRRQSTETLLEMGLEYLAIGSLVPFFNRNHRLNFVAQVIQEARQAIGPDLPMHVYGAGDPLELPFLAAAGATIFDSSSYGHYALGGWYMTPYGAIKAPDYLAEGAFACPCPVCEGQPDAEIWNDTAALAAHNLWCILHTLENIREHLQAGTLETRLSTIMNIHMRWFPDSDLQRSWEQYHGA